MDEKETTALAERVASRLCHDLINPLGAIQNGLELMALSGDADGAEFALIEESLAAATARVAFYRIAFGGVGDDPTMPPEDALKIAHALYEGSRISLDWHPYAPCPRSLLRRAYLALLCLETALPRGGTIAIRKAEDGWSGRVENDHLKIELSHWNVLTSKGSSSAQIPVQFSLLREHAETALDVAQGPNRIELTF